MNKNLYQCSPSHL